MRKKVLIIEDEVEIREALFQYLELSGYEAIEAPHGDYALEVLTQQPIDVVVTDLVMPQKDGRETIIQAKRSWPNLVIIAISGALYTPVPSMGDPTKEIAAATDALGVDGFLRKPFRAKELVDLIESLTAPATKETPGILLQETTYPTRTGI